MKIQLENVKGLHAEDLTWSTHVIEKNIAAIKSPLDVIKEFFRGKSPVNAAFPKCWKYLHHHDEALTTVLSLVGHELKQPLSDSDYECKPFQVSFRIVIF